MRLGETKAKIFQSMQPGEAAGESAREDARPTQPGLRRRNYAIEPLRRIG